MTTTLNREIGRQIRAKLLSPFVSQRLTFLISSEQHSHIERLARFLEEGSVVLEEGSVVPAVGCRYRLEEAPLAIADLEAGRALGKPVVVVGEDS